MIRQLVKQGKVYGGGSAGAIIAGPTIDHFQSVDSPVTAENSTLTGLNLTDVVVIPHWEAAKYEKAYQNIEQELQADSYKTVHITDEQAFVIKSDSRKVI